MWTPKLPFRGRIVEAEYKDPGVETYRGNPFIEALPPILSEDKAVEKMRYYPYYDQSMREAPPELRLHSIMDILCFVEPLPEYRDLERRISRLIRIGYLGRNPAERGFVQKVHKQVEAVVENDGYPLPLAHQPSASGFAILGISGIGKSTAIERVLSLYPQVITHRNYPGMNIMVDQVVWLKLDCPYDGSVKGLCHNFFTELDAILGTNYAKTPGSYRKTVDALIQDMSRIALLHGIGVLVVDEIQHLSVAKSGGAEKMLNFFVTLMNVINLPVILVGTPKARRILTAEFRQTRRACGQGDMIRNRMREDAVWRYFIEALWQFQYTKYPTPLTDEISHVLYEESQGITDFAVKLYILSQIRAIESKYERITPAIIRSAAKDGLQLAKPTLQALKYNDRRVLENIEDVYIDVEPYVHRIVSRVEFQPQNSTANQPVESSIVSSVTTWLQDVGVPPGVARAAAEKALGELGIRASLSEIKQLAFKLVIEQSSSMESPTSKRDKSKKKPSDQSAYSIVNLVKQGRKRGLSAYESLKANGLIALEAELLQNYS